MREVKNMRKAAFDRVDEEGNIILSLDGEQIVLEAPDRLEEALLASRKIKAQAGSQKRLAPSPSPKYKIWCEPEKIQSR